MAAKKKLYSFDDHPEHRAELGAWAEKWKRIIMSTDAMSDADREQARNAALRLYEAAKLPAPKHVVFVPSPFVARFAGGFAAWIWYLHHQAATDAATRAATSAATLAATLDATDAATYDATLPIASGPDDDWYACDRQQIVALSKRFGGRAALECAQKAYSMWSGGNQWCQWDSYLTFFRHVAKLPLDYDKYDAWETLARVSGPRIMHADFCIISDRPERLLVDDRNRPHCENGPFCRWRDGSALYAWHGIYTPRWIIEHPERITVAKIDAEQNAEIRRVMIERFGVARYAEAGETLDEDTDELGHTRKLVRQRGRDGAPDLLVCLVQNSTLEPDGSRKQYALTVHPECRPLLSDGFGLPQKLTCRNAVASTFGVRGDEWTPEVQT